MKNSKLLEIIRTFNREEFKLLGKFIESTYFGVRRDCTPLYNALKKYYPKLDENDVKKEKIFSEVFPGKKYDGKNSETLLLTMSSDMYKLCKEFLVYIELNEERIQKEHMLLKQLLKRKLMKEFTREYEKISAGRNESASGALDFLNSYHLINSYGEFCQRQGNVKGLYESFMRSSENALAFAFINGCRFIDIIDIAVSSFNLEKQYNFTESLIDSLDVKGMLEKMERANDPFYPYIAANTMVYMMAKEPSDMQNYETLKELMNGNHEKFSHTEKFFLYNIMINYLINKDNKHHSEDLTRETFELSKVIVELGVYKSEPGSSFNATLYRNTLSVAFEVGELEWAEMFINKTSHELPAELAEGMRDYSLANLCFIKREFEKALSYIININYDYLTHKIDAKVLQFKIYYELSNYEQCYSVIDTTKHYLSSTEELGEVFVERNSNFLKYANELVKRKTDKNVKDLGFTIEKLREEKSTESKNWLIGKLEELVK